MPRGRKKGHIELTEERKQELKELLKDPAYLDAAIYKMADALSDNLVNQKSREERSS